MATMEDSTAVSGAVQDMLRRVPGWITPPGAALRLARTTGVHVAIRDVKQELDALAEQGRAERRTSGTVTLYAHAVPDGTHPVA